MLLEYEGPGGMEYLPDALPEDVEAERSLLATICAAGQEAEAAEILSRMDELDFAKPQHRAVFNALGKILGVGGEVSLLTLNDELKRQHTADSVGGFTGLTEILMANEVGRPSILADILKTKRKYRDLIKWGANLSRQAAAENGTPEELIQNITTSLMDLLQGRNHKGLDFIHTVGEAAMKHIVDVAEGRATPGIPLGIPRLDRMLGGGVKPGQLIVLAARPGIGKSALAVQWCEHTARRNMRSALWSLEMGAEEIWTRLAAKQTRIQSYRLATGNLDQAEWLALEEAKENIQTLPLLINDQAEITTLGIRAQMDHALSRFGKVSLGVVDYLQLMTSMKDANRQKSESTRVGEITRAFKLLAKDRGVPIILLSQLNREVEKRAGGKPQLSDLRDSGSIEQDADVVLFLHRKSQNQQSDVHSEASDDTAELIVAKNRNGPTGIIPLTADLANFTFYERERETGASGLDPWKGVVA